ncbi:phosphatase PAP2 family protein [Egibacter rhizosphaerae]|uniref:Phosphatase PAP2 family protein n=1 Tax=Egibacter rhizosphaerae TaxID=1670831 RepID=A0A411YLQ5_9ACTN|nr:phosphatase PAP2 family protein [Egibacter rhizosphaerae]
MLVGAAVTAVAWRSLGLRSAQRLDVRLGDALRARRRPGRRADRWVVATTDLGSLYAVGGASATLAWLGRREAAGDVAGIGLLAWVVGQRTKRFVRRKRPYEADGVRRLIRPPTGSSFPSGHAAVAAAVAEVLADEVHPLGRVALRGVAGYVAASRVDVGVHYASDVLGGAGIGIALAGLWRLVPPGRWRRA